MGQGKSRVKTRFRGATGISYGLVVGLIAVVAITAITTSGSSIRALFTETSDTLEEVNGSAASDGAPESSAVPSPSASPLFEFTSHTFTSCGQTGRTGPSESACETAYSGAGLWVTDNALYTVSGGIQTWTVPETADYRITAVGARGGVTSSGSAGQGATILGTFSLTEGDQIKILVGQPGTDNSGENCDSGGGGGSFVSDASNTPLIVAGGGGGAGTNSHSGQNGVNAGLTETPTGNASCTRDIGAAATGGNGGPAGCCSLGSGGGGFFSNGATSDHGSNIPGGTSFVGGGNGGSGNDANANGGFGGGGGGHGNCHIGSGPGGGYNGGRSSEDCGGGGGGSFNAGGDPATGSFNNGSGSVTIKKM
ncbi:MAG: hypothetical protein Alpg2KO_29010 [Alphaproteobacteria bacterium]